MASGPPRFKLENRAERLRRFVPEVIDPRGRFPAFSRTDEPGLSSLRRIGISVKNDDSRSIRIGGFLEVAEGNLGHAMGFESAAPIVGPRVEAALLVHFQRQELLFISYRFSNRFLIGFEVVDDVLMFSNFESDAGRIAGDFLRAIPLPIMADKELAFDIEKRFQPSNNDHVQIQEQRGAFQVSQPIFEKGQLFPTAFGNSVGQ